MHRPLLFVTALALLGGCGPTYVRGSEAPGLDDRTMSTGIDRRDMEQLLHENLKALMSSTAANRWNQDRSKPIVAIYPLSNETSEHIESELRALLSDVETFLVNANLVRVVSVERQPQMMAELDRQHGGGFDPRQIAAYNRQLGAQYYLTGKVFTADERTEDARRVQYFMFMQLIDVETSEVVWQNKAAFTKALLR